MIEFLIYAIFWIAVLFTPVGIIDMVCREIKIAKTLK